MKDRGSVSKKEEATYQWHRSIVAFKSNPFAAKINGLIGGGGGNRIN